MLPETVHRGVCGESAASSTRGMPVVAAYRIIHNLDFGKPHLHFARQIHVCDSWSTLVVMRLYQSYKAVLVY